MSSYGSSDEEASLSLRRRGSGLGGSRTREPNRELFELQANQADEVVENYIDAYHGAFRGRTTLTESIYTEVTDQAEQLEELQGVVRNMIEHTNDEQLLCNLVILFDHLGDILTKHQELVREFADKLEQQASTTSTSSTSTSTSAAPIHTPQPSADDWERFPPLESGSHSSSGSWIDDDEILISTTTTTTTASTSSTAPSAEPGFESTSTRNLGTSLRLALDQSTKMKSGGLLEQEKAVTCPICYCDIPVSQVFSFVTCDHFYCLDCIREYYKTAAAEGRLLNIRCPTPDCETQVQFEDIQGVMDREWCEKFQDFALLAFMRLDPTTRWCPKPNCNTAVMVDVDPNDPTTKKVSCPKCSHEYCYGCGLEYHGDTTCEVFKKVAGDNTADDRFAKWASGKAKRCPKCNIFIEKNEGCNHMTCSSCQHQWCWLCMGDYSSSHYSEGRCAGRQFSAEVEDHVFTLDAGGRVIARRRRRPWRTTKKALKVTGITMGVIAVTPLVIVGAVVVAPFLPLILKD